MVTNAFLQKYIDSQATISRERKRLMGMAWSTTGICDIKITPQHFNYFYFEVSIKGVATTLTIRDAKALAIYLLKNTEGLPDEDTHGIMKEIIKKENDSVVDPE